jgi:XrtN system VIT domain protein
MENKAQNWYRRLLNSGFILIPVLIILFIIHFLIKDNRPNFEDAIVIPIFSFIFSLTYFFFVIFTNRPFYKFLKINKNLLILSLVHFAICCFTLNLSIPIFATFVWWTYIYIGIMFLALVGLIFSEKLHPLLRYIEFFILGLSLILTLYFSIYLAPWYFIGFIAILLLGLGVLLFIPLIISSHIIYYFIRIKKNRIDHFAFYSGIVVPLIVIAVFMFQWNDVQKEIQKSSASIVTRPDNSLPEWVLFCQDISNDPFTQTIIKGDLFYETFHNSFWGFDRTLFGENKEHNPLINIGLAFFGDLNLDENTRIKILKSQFDARHLAQRKLWSSEDLGTIEVLNHIKVFPDYRMAYTEKIITVKNYSSYDFENQEAAYTFYLPEGSVASSLSLWINGKEEKSRLSSKEKADSAYVQIVGVENRDPSIMHWQEGNRLTVTVFPCTTKENRRFKIGITSPLTYENGYLILPNIYFEGPTIKKIDETTKIEFESEHDVKEIQLPESFEKGINKDYLYSGTYIPYWELKCKATPLSAKPFTFQDHSYTVSQLQKETIPFHPDTLFLDLNRSWSEDEYQQVVTLLKGKKVFVIQDQIIQITPDNEAAIFDQFVKKNFSLFPFYKIPNAAHTLVISKSTLNSPNLSDLEDSKFLNQLASFFKIHDSKINLYQLGNCSSNYIKSLKELQVFHFYSGNMATLAQLIKDQTFGINKVDSNSVILENAQMIISSKENSGVSKAPDHLLRLYAYNKIMQELGKDYLNKEYAFNQHLISMANEAYIVSPVSSLVVLETKNDYDRFGIDENKNSLKNASMESSGAVPEPHEWALILVFVGIGLFLFVKSKPFKS